MSVPEDKIIPTDELRQVRDWCASRQADKPWYTEFGDSPKLLTKCDVMISLIDEVLASRSDPKGPRS